MDTNETNNPETGLDVHSAAAEIGKIMFPSDEKDTQGQGDDETPVEASAEDADDQQSEEQAESDNAEAAEDDDAESGDEEDAGEEETADDEPRYTVKVDGKEIEVTESELKAGYSRQSHFTRSMQALADQRKAVEAEADAARQERAKYAQYLGILEEQVKASSPSEVDWNRRFDEDPIAASKEYALWQQNQVRLANIQQEQRAVQQQEQIEQQRAMEALLVKEIELLGAKAPSLVNEKTGPTQKQAIREYAVTQLGFSPDEINGVTDHRAIIALQKAWLYDQAQARAKATKHAAQKAAPVAKPGSAGAPRQGTELTRSKQRLAKTGSVKDAASVIAKLI